MELDRIEGNIFWFKFLHHAYYRELQQSFWIAADSLNHNSISVCFNVVLFKTILKNMSKESDI